MSIKARITILRMTGPRWVDKISNTQTKCCILCDYFTVNFFLPIADMHTVSTLIIWTKLFLIFNFSRIFVFYSRWCCFWLHLHNLLNKIFVISCFSPVFAVFIVHGNVAVVKVSVIGFCLFKVTLLVN